MTDKPAYSQQVTPDDPGLSCRDCCREGGTYRDPCGRCGAPFAYTANAGRLAWLLRKFGSAEHGDFRPSTAQWDVAAHLDREGVTADA